MFRQAPTITLLQIIFVASDIVDHRSNKNKFGWSSTGNEGVPIINIELKRALPEELSTLGRSHYEELVTKAPYVTLRPTLFP